MKVVKVPKYLCETVCTLWDTIHNDCRWPRVARLCDPTNNKWECPIDPKENVERYKRITNGKKKHFEQDGY